MPRLFYACLLAATVAAPAARAQPDRPIVDRVDAIRVTPQKQVLELQWSDAEDTLKGAVSPVDLREGDPLTVSVRIASFQGAPFEGPVTLTLRAADEKGGQTETVEPVDGTWSTTFVPRTAGPHTLDVAFRTTHYKALHAPLSVSPSRLPRWIAWALLGFIAVLALGLGVYRVLKRPSTPADPPLTT